jgi:hypothetical protein
MVQWEGKKPTEAEMKEIYELRALLDNRKTFSRGSEVYGESAGEIEDLIQRIEIGLKPIERKCSKCPNVTTRKSVEHEL